MAIDEYHVEQDRRVNTLISEVATIREQTRSTKEAFDELKRGTRDLEIGQNQVLASVAKIIAASERMEATLKYNIDAQIDAKLSPIKIELEELKKEAIIRKTQIAMWSMFGGGLGTTIVYVGGFLLKLWGH